MSGQKPEFYFFNIYVILLILLNIKRRTYSFAMRLSCSVFLPVYLQNNSYESV